MDDKNLKFASLSLSVSLSFLCNAENPSSTRDSRHKVFGDSDTTCVDWPHICDHLIDGSSSCILRAAMSAISRGLNSFAPIILIGLFFAVFAQFVLFCFASCQPPQSMYVAPKHRSAGDGDWTFGSSLARPPLLP